MVLTVNSCYFLKQPSPVSGVLFEVVTEFLNIIRDSASKGL
jgi:hypothetical protein